MPIPPKKDPAAYKKQLLDAMSMQKDAPLNIQKNENEETPQEPDPVSDALNEAMVYCKKGDMKTCELAIRKAIIANSGEESDETQQGIEENADK